MKRIQVGGFRGMGRDQFFGSDVLFASDGASFVVTGRFGNGPGFFTTYEYRERGVFLAGIRLLGCGLLVQAVRP